jgi:hypothetical protein
MHKLIAYPNVYVLRPADMGGGGRLWFMGIMASLNLQGVGVIRATWTGAVSWDAYMCLLGRWMYQGSSINQSELVKVRGEQWQMATIPAADRSDNPTLQEVMDYAESDLMDVHVRRFNGRTFRRSELESLYIVSPIEVLLLFSVQRAMAAHLALQSLMERSGSEIGQVTMSNLTDSHPGYEKLFLLVDAMGEVWKYELELDRRASEPI